MSVVVHNKLPSVNNRRPFCFRSSPEISYSLAPSDLGSPAAVAEGGRSATMRARRAKLKSCRDDNIVAQGQRGTSAALGSERKMICSPFSGLARQPATTREKLTS